MSWLAGGEGPPRVAFAVGRRVGGAVARNRVRRRLRSLARASTLPAGAWLVGAGPGAGLMSYAELSAHWSAAVEHLVGAA